MKILYVNSLYEPYVGGGAEITLRTLVEGMRDLGHEVVVLSTGPEQGLTEAMVNGVRVLRAAVNNIYWQHHRGSRGVWRKAVWHIRDIYNRKMSKVVEETVRRERPDIVSCHNLAGWSAAAWTGIASAKVPIVQVLHDFYNLCPNSNMFRSGRTCERRCAQCVLFRTPHRMLSKKVSAVVGVSRFVLEKHLNYGYFSKSAHRLAIHNARNWRVPETLLPPRDSDRVRFGYLGTLAPAKGVTLLLEEFSALESKNAELFIAGKGAPEYERQLRKYESERIHFLGYASPEDFYSSIDVLVVPSIWQEPLGMVVAEAFAFGVPVVGSRRGGIPEMIQEGVNGWLFEPTRQGELRSMLELLAEDPRIIQEIRVSVFASSKPYMDVREWALRYAALYESVLCGGQDL